MVMSRTPLSREKAMFEPLDEDDNEALQNKGPSLDEMAEQLAKVQQELEDERKLRFSANTQNPLPLIQTVEPQLVKLPDPALDGEAYAQAVERNIRARLEAERKNSSNEQNRSQTIQQRLDQIWKDFNEEHEDLMKGENSQERVEFASTKVLKRAKDRGVDVEKFMFNTPGLFRDEVAKEYVRLFGAPDAEEDDEELEVRSRKGKKGKNARRVAKDTEDADDDADDSRAASIFGGSEFRGKQGKGKDKDEGPDMIADIQNMQRRLGLF